MGRIGGDVEQLLTVIRFDTSSILRKVQPRGIPAVPDRGRPVHLAAARVEQRKGENSLRSLLQLPEIEE